MKYENMSHFIPPKIHIENPYTRRTYYGQNVSLALLFIDQHIIVILDDEQKYIFTY